jgi:hypothetical protein
MSPPDQARRSEVGRPGDGFLVGHSRRAVLTAHQQMAGEVLMVGREVEMGQGWLARAVCREVDPEMFCVPRTLIVGQA